MEKHDYFFEPWIGDHYEEGFKGVKILVVGLCHFCTEQCEFRKQCSSPAGIWGHDTNCPYYAKFDDQDYYRLRNSNLIEITSFVDGDAPYPTYKLFTYYMLNCAGDLASEKKRKLWDHLAFTNFLQFFHDDRDALPSDPALYEEAYPAFREIMEKASPEVVCVWNDAIKECLKAHKDELVYLGKADLSIGIPIYIFLPHDSQLKGSRLDRFRYRLGIQSEKHHSGWYKKLLKKHIGSCINESEKDGGKIINNLAHRIMDLVDSGYIGTTEDNLYFRNTDQHTWTSRLKGFFLESIKQAYPTLGRGFNPGMEAIFRERLSTNKKDPCEPDGSEGKIARAIRNTFPVNREKKPLKKAY